MTGRMTGSVMVNDRKHDANDGRRTPVLKSSRLRSVCPRQRTSDNTTEPWNVGSYGGNVIYVCDRTPTASTTLTHTATKFCDSCTMITRVLKATRVFSRLRQQPECSSHSSRRDEGCASTMELSQQPGLT